MKILSIIFAALLWVSGLAGQCALTVQIDAKPELKICSGSFYTLRPKVNVAANFIWYKDGKAVVLPFAGQYIVSEPGVYQVEASSIADSTCKAISAKVVVSTVSTPTVDLIAHASSFCQGDSVLIQSEFDSSHSWTFQWFKNDLPVVAAVEPKITISSGGSYSLKLQHAECEVYSEIVSIKELPKPKADFEFSLAKQKGVNFINLSDGGVSFVWSFGDGKSSQLANPSHIFSTSGQYTIELTAVAKNGCIDVVSKFLSVGTTSIAAVELAEGDLLIYPNPTNGLLNFRSEIDVSGASVHIFDVQGKFLELQQISTAGSVDLSGYDAGIYVLHISRADQKSVHKVTKI